MKTELIQTGHLTSQLNVVIETDDYKTEFEKELRKQQNKAHLKGFRKGKTPLSAVRKMFGKSILGELINDKMQKAIGDYIVEHELDILGNPLPAPDQQLIDFDPKNLVDYPFKFDLGLAPEITVNGLEGVSYDTYEVGFGDTEIDEELDNLRKRNGTQEEIDAPVEVMDIVSASITSLADDAEWTGDITFMPDRLNSHYRDEIIGRTAGFEMDVDIYEFEKNASEDYVSKYFLKDAPEGIGRQFKVQLKGAKRLVPAEMNEEFFTKLFSEDIKSEADAREFLRTELQKYYASQATAITKRRILESLIDSNYYDFPDTFLKRWLIATNDKLSEDQVDEEYSDFTKNLTWTLIKQKLAKEYEINITPEAIRASLVEKFKAQFAQYGYGQMGDLDFDGIGDRMMQNQESVQKEYEELLSQEVLDQIMERVTLAERKINMEEYQQMIDDFQKNNAES
ncbi:MAG: trigger factor [Bacteroidota bacterium]